MEILIDTNVILDYLLQRKGYEDAKNVLQLATVTENEVIEYVTAFSITDIQYWLQSNLKENDDKELERNKRCSFVAQDRIKALFKLVSVLPIAESDILDALDLRWVDFEDAVQYTLAKNNNISIIITKNKKDFEKDDVELYSPEEFLKSRK